MNNQRIFVGIYPAGIVYADRTVEIDGDYARLAFHPLSMDFWRYRSAHQIEL